MFYNFLTTTYQGRYYMLSVQLTPIVSIIAGVLILILPHLLNYIVAFYLIIAGIMGLGIVHF